MKRAVIDLGTNTFNVLVADVSAGGFTVLHTSKQGVALGMGGINEGIIAPAAMKRALKAFSDFMQVCVKHQVFAVHAIGTSALRDARNGHELVAKVRELYGVQIQIVDGLTEAKLIYEGVRWLYHFERPSVIMDIGGGSTEFIQAYNDTIQHFCSLDIGVSRAIQKFPLRDPLSTDDQAELISWFESKAEPMKEFDRCKVMVGASGSFETFYEMETQQTFPKESKMVPLDMNRLMNSLDWLIQSTYVQRQKHPFIIPIRTTMAHVAALKVKWAIEKFGIEELCISPYSLKEGALRLSNYTRL